MSKSYSRGYEIYYDGETWRYSDNNNEIDKARPCKKCGGNPTKEGHDYCLGTLENVTSACCGHGVEPPMIVNSLELLN